MRRILHYVLAGFWECFRVFAKDREALLMFECSGGSAERVFFHMDVITGNIPEMNHAGHEDVQDIISVLNKWYEIFKDELLDGFKCGKYKALSNKGDFD